MLSILIPRDERRLLAKNWFQELLKHSAWKIELKGKSHRLHKLHLNELEYFIHFSICFRDSKNEIMLFSISSWGSSLFFHFSNMKVNDLSAEVLRQFTSKWMISSLLSRSRTSADSALNWKWTWMVAPVTWKRYLQRERRSKRLPNLRLITKQKDRDRLDLLIGFSFQIQASLRWRS